MCIYYKDRQDLSYESGEHTIPAGLGGIRKLPNDMVSSQFNNFMSKYETWLLQDSVINSIRQIIGPGSRGRTSARHQSKSQVHLMENLPPGSEFSVGYIKKGAPHTLPYFCFDAASLRFSYGLENTENLDVSKALGDFAKALDEPALLRIKTTCDDRLSPTTIYFGWQKGLDTKFDAFYYKHPDNEMPSTGRPFAAFASTLRQDQVTSHPTNHQVKSHQNLNWKMEYFQVFAKSCFNFLAEVKGKEFALQGCFDPVRQWIAEGGTNQFADFLTVDIEVLKHMNVRWPPYSHIILLIPEGSILYGICSFYKTYTVKVILSTSLSSPFQTEGWICDWQSRREYSLQRYIMETAINKVAPGH